MSGLEEIQSQDLTTSTEQSTSGFTVELAGTAEGHATHDLRAFFTRLHGVAAAAGVPEVLIDLRRLEFMNSSSFKAFVGWIASLRDAPAEKQYKVRLVSDPKKHWQRRSLGALASFAPDLVHVDSDRAGTPDAS